MMGPVRKGQGPIFQIDANPTTGGEGGSFSEENLRRLYLEGRGALEFSVSLIKYSVSCRIARWSMAVIDKAPSYRVDGRVSIAMDALDEKQKKAVCGVISDPAHFLKSVSDSKRVQKLSKDKHIYTIKVPSGLRIVYSRVGDEIVVLDLMRQATLSRYGRKSLRQKGRGRRKPPSGSRSK